MEKSKKTSAVVSWQEMDLDRLSDYPERHPACLDTNMQTKVESLHRRGEGRNISLKKRLRGPACAVSTGELGHFQNH